jgi:hypothetical protein
VIDIVCSASVVSARLVVGQEVQRRHAQWDDDVEAGTAAASNDRLAQQRLIAEGVGDDEQAFVAVVRPGWQPGADARALEGDRYQRRQRKNDRGDDREPDPADRRRLDQQRDDERLGSEDRADGDQQEADADRWARSPHFAADLGSPRRSASARTTASLCSSSRAA